MTRSETRKRYREANKLRAKDLEESGNYPPPPEKCSRVDCCAPKLVFEKRRETCGWRTVCNYCRYNNPERKEKRAAALKAWCLKNPDKVKKNNERMSEKRRTDVNAKMNSILSCAKQNGFVVIEEDLEKMKLKLCECCFYCGKSTDTELSTLDRVQSGLEYSDANTVPACKFCNFFKGVLSIDLFVHKVRRIADHMQIAEDALLATKFEAESSSRFGKHRSYGKKDKTVEIDIQDAINLWFSPCNYCGVFPAFAIDRVDSDKNYTKENVVPCCTVCNSMKKDLSLEELRFRVAKVVEHTKLWALGDFRDDDLTDAGRKKKFLKVHAGDGKYVVFPSNNLNIGGKKRLIKGDPATPREFWEQVVTPEECLQAFQNRLVG